MKDATRLWIVGVLLGAVSLVHIGMAMTGGTAMPFTQRAIAFGVISVAAFLGDIAQRLTAAR